MSVRDLPVIAVTSLVSAPPPADTLTAGRSWSLVATAFGVAGVVVGAVALARSAGRTGAVRNGAIVALSAGLIGAVLGGLVVTAAEGGPGTGYGIVGGVAAVVIGLGAMCLGVLARMRSRRHGRSADTSTGLRNPG